jgi:hypothetical protein
MLVGLCVLGSSSWAQVSFETPAEDRPLYPNLRVGGGGTFQQDAQLDSFTYYRRPLGTSSPADSAVSATFPAESDVKFDIGPSMSVALGGGLRMPDWLHVEVETGFSHNPFSFRAGGAEFEGDLWQIPVSVNATVPWQISRSVDVFGGLGVGGVFGVLDLGATDVQVRDLPGYQESVTITGTRFTGVGMLQAFAGARYRFNPSSALSLSYRFRGTTPPNWSGTSSLDGEDGEWQLDLSRLYSHTVSLMYELNW